MHLVVGASGALGQRVTHRLLEAGEAVRVASRSPERLEGRLEVGREGRLPGRLPGRLEGPLKGPFTNAVPVTGDLRDPATFPGMLEGARTVIVAAHGLVPPSISNHPGVVDGRGVRALVDAARQAGVERFVFTSVAGADRGTTAFARVKHATERHLAASGLRHTILRPTLFMESHALVLMGEPLRSSGTVNFLGRGETRVNWIAADDVAAEAVAAVLDPAAPSVTLELGGPDDMTRREALVLLEQALGREARRKHVPLPVVKLMRGVLGVVHPGMRYLLDMVLAEEKAREAKGAQDAQDAQGAQGAQGAPNAQSAAGAQDHSGGRDAPPEPGARRFDRVGPTTLTAVIAAWAAA